MTDALNFGMITSLLQVKIWFRFCWSKLIWGKHIFLHYTWCCLFGSYATWHII